MTGTVKQDGALMAKTMASLAENLLLDRDAFSGINTDMKVSDVRINIPYSVYSKESTENNK